MAVLLDRFMEFHGNGTKQIGRYFCIPATVSNALRLLNGLDFTQERIRDEWYKSRGREIEANIDEQLVDAGPGIVDVLKRQTDFCQRFATHEYFETVPKEECGVVFHESKAEKAVEFILNNVAEGRPVMVSTDGIHRVPGALIRIPSHMWLILDANLESNSVTYHDPATDSVSDIALRAPCTVPHIGKEVGFDNGLRGRITVVNHFCQAFGRL